ncbi:MAG: hypothetical protein GY774_01205 [Planctomycetes bacterium]|nr:hypothetical protein [Planctomycetota bacterium]
MDREREQKLNRQSKRRSYLLYAGSLIAFLAVSGFLFVYWVITRVPPGHPRHVDHYKLKELHSAVITYYIEYNEIPLEGELKQLLIERNIVEDEDGTAFKSHPGLEIRYFTSENRFVFVAPGRNGRYDTPEGYEAIEAIEDTGDDFVQFGRILKKLWDRNEQEQRE